MKEVLAGLEALGEDMLQLKNAPTGRVLSDNLAKLDTFEGTSGPPAAGLDELRRSPEKVLELRDQKTKQDVDALEKAYRTLPRSAEAGNLVRLEAISLAPLLSSYPGQTEDTRLAESTLSRMGVNPSEAAKSWSTGQRDYYVRMIGLAADEGRGGGQELRRNGAVDPGVAKEIFRRTEALASSKGS